MQALMETGQARWAICFQRFSCRDESRCPARWRVCTLSLLGRRAIVIASTAVYRLESSAATIGLLVLVQCGEATDGAQPAVSGPDAGLSVSASSSASAQREQVDRGSDEIKPVYPIDNSPPDPVAKRFCDAVQTLPAERKAACCEDSARAPFAAECTRTLSAALRSKAVSVDEAAVLRCEEAAKRAYEGCGWVGRFPAQPPAECLGIFKGHLAEGATCRSNLECEKGLTCYGLAATFVGKCSKPRPKGAVCNTGIETLANLTRQGRMADTEHPTCEGFCNKVRCADAPPLGEACKSSVTCGHGRTCVNDKCSDKALPAEGEACAAGECSIGLRCVESKCAKPLLDGAACTIDAACFGSCVDGTCKKLCQATMSIPSSRPTAGSGRAPRK